MSEKDFLFLCRRRLQNQLDLVSFEQAVKDCEPFAHLTPLWKAAKAYALNIMCNGCEERLRMICEELTAGEPTPLFCPLHGAPIPGVTPRSNMSVEQLMKLFEASIEDGKQLTIKRIPSGFWVGYGNFAVAHGTLYDALAWTVEHFIDPSCVREFFNRLRTEETRSATPPQPNPSEPGAGAPT